jgi:hypothetical protein
MLSHALLVLLSVLVAPLTVAADPSSYASATSSRSVSASPTATHAASTPTPSVDALNVTIPSYTDGVLHTIASNPPTNVSRAAVEFRSGPRSLRYAYVRFTQLNGTDSLGRAAVVLELSVPANLSSTNNIFTWAGVYSNQAVGVY